MLRRASILLLVTLVVCLPAWTIPDLHGTEGRRVQITVEMMQSGDWLVPTLGWEPTWAKPPLHYWLLAGSRWLFGDSVLAMRLPSVVLAFASAWLAGELLRRHFGSVTGWLGAVAMLCAPVGLFEWPTAEIDPGFASLTAMSLWSLATGVARERRGLVFVSGVFAGLALLDKGPPFFLFAVGAYLVWWRHRRLRHGLLHFAPALALPLVWVVLVWISRVSPAEALAAAGEESVGRLSLFSMASLRAIPAYWLRALAVQLPFVLWCFWEWRGNRDARMDAGDLTLRMCSGAAVVAVVLFMFFPGRPTRYLLPNIPLFTFAVMPAVAHFFTWPGALPGIASRLVLAWGLGGAAMLIVIPFAPVAGTAAVAVALCAAIGPLVVRRPAHVVVFCLLTPVIGAWTVGFDVPVGRGERVVARQRGGEVLAHELRRLGVADDLATYGHVDSAVLLATGRLPHGDEFRRRQPTARWLLYEGHAGEPAPFGYTLRTALDLEFKTYCVAEREVGGR